MVEDSFAYLSEVTLCVKPPDGTMLDSIRNREADIRTIEGGTRGLVALALQQPCFHPAGRWAYGQWAASRVYSPIFLFAISSVHGRLAYLPLPIERLKRICDPAVAIVDRV